MIRALILKERSIPHLVVHEDRHHAGVGVAHDGEMVGRIPHLTTRQRKYDAARLSRPLLQQITQIVVFGHLLINVAVAEYFLRRQVHQPGLWLWV